MLNVGPTGEGIIPVLSVSKLKEMGEWLKVNGEAVYGTTSSPFGKFAWGRCTKKVEEAETTLYFSVFKRPQDGKLLIPQLTNKVLESTLLATNENIKTSTSTEGLQIELPEIFPDAIASVIKIRIEGKVDIVVDE